MGTRRPVDRLRPGEQTGADWKAPACVYVITSQGRVKIGIATDAKVRMGYLQLACPYPLALVAERQFASRREARDAEKALHVQFAAQRLWGEWFDVDVQIVLEAFCLTPA
jgi:hypothetical protein